MTNGAEAGTDLVFLGVCERAACVQDGNTNLVKWNVLGLKHVVLSYIYPLPLRGITLALALSTSTTRSEFDLHVLDPNGQDIGFVTLGTMSLSAEEAGNGLPNGVAPILAAPHGSWVPAFLSLPEDSPILIQNPGSYSLTLRQGENMQPVGAIHFVAIDPPPLTADRVAAIKSDPGASKAVRMEVGCKHCPTKARGYAALDRSKETEDSGWTWYQELPEVYRCDCGRSTVNLEFIRRNLHGLLGQRSVEGDNIRFVPLYERGALDSIRDAYARLLTSAKCEEDLQKFIEKNPVLLHQFPAERLFPKPAILTFFNADFAVVTPMRELILIELERADTRLMRKNGDVAAPLSHALDQVSDWLQVVDDHRLAVLASLGVEKEQVSSVRGVVIAGRDIGCDAQQLRKLKGVDRGRISLLTYDDVLFSLDALIRRIGAI